MEKYIKELAIIFIQLIVFYVLPLFAGPADTMGLVLLMLILTLILSIIVGYISNKKIKYIYPIITAILFIPSVFIYFNESALIHSIWYLVDSSIGLGIGFLFNKLKR